jgi:hypothetical protein
MRVLNTELFLHPVNWLTIFLMLVIAAVAGHELLTLAQLEPATKQ